MFKLNYILQEEAESTSAVSSGSLLDTGESSNEETETNQGIADTETNSESGEVFQEEEVAVARPEWLPEEFESTDALLESHNSLKEKMGVFQGSPEEYEMKGYDNFTFHEGTDNDIAGFMVMAKEMGINQEGFDKLVDYYVAGESQRATLEAEARKAEAYTMLGGDKVAGERIKSIAAKAQTSMSAEQYTLFQQATSGSHSSGGAAILLVESLLKGESKPLANNTSVNTPKLTEGQVREMMKDPKYGKDKEYNAKVAKAFAELYNE